MVGERGRVDAYDIQLLKMHRICCFLCRLDVGEDTIDFLLLSLPTNVLPLI